MKKELLDQREFDRLKEIKKRHRDSLFSLPNVNGVGIGLKEVNGKATGILRLDTLRGAR